MSSIDMSRIRNEYARSGLAESDAGDDPIALFDVWMAEAVAAGLHEPTAMALATASPDGKPSVRIVLLKGIDGDGVRFYTNYESRKGEELESNPYAALTMLWHQIERQVRIEGTVARTSPGDSDAYFASRPHGSQLGAVASPQSRAIADRGVLDEHYADAAAAYPDGVSRPAYWGGYLVRPESVEFWQGRESRMHDRIKFTRAPSGWHRERLAP
ncbi:pyridoxamine 5'-phosphate oxidase [Solicola gregarius]|uniref:Pyridoxine/pyridoxamine 5'-phosphate oxidase n=1 Tax=Solicola gregarius TaxID=2908642 RepID=A0AA46TKB0_9ACTN|nr:pyridoxamine 5'-phosphate oxidase [Solicola gregarius]UYM06693.1 pyridoxamine 5'-phosphate oxidase [Solicola gregarius]